MSRLFRADVSVTIVVEADDERDAYMNAQEMAAEELRDNQTGSVYVSEISTDEDIPRGWADCCAWGGDGIKTISQTIAEQIEACDE